MYRLLIAYRYVFSRFITFVALMLVTSSVMVLIIVVSVMEGFRSELEKRIRGTASDINVESKLYVGLREPDAVQETLRRIPGVLATTAYVEALALHRVLGRGRLQEAEERHLTTLNLKNPHAVSQFEQYVRDLSPPDLHFHADSEEQRRFWQDEAIPLVKRFFSLLPKDVEGLFSDQWTKKDLWRRDLWAPWRGLGGIPPRRSLPPIVVGIENVRRELLLPGDRVELTSFSPRNETVKGEFVVAGYFKTGLYEIDAKGLLLRLEDAANFLNLRGPDDDLRVSGIRVTADGEHQEGPGLTALRESVDQALAGAEVLLVRTQTWRDARASLLRAVRVEKLIMSIILGVVILFASFMIFIILTVQVVEKSRDIGVLQSIGATSRGIASTFFLIGLSLCLAGTILGSIYGIAFALSVNTIQRWVKLLTGLELFPPDVYYLDYIPVRFQAEDLLFIVVPAVAASLVASVIPALRAARKDPAQVLRYE